MEEMIEQTNLDAHIRRIFFIEDVTQGTDKDIYLFRYRGHLLSENSEAAYDQIASALAPLNLTPLFRWDDNRHAILIIPGLPKPKPSNPWINIILFVLTICSVLATGGLYGIEGELPQDVGGIIKGLITNGWPFAVSMMAILAAHEFGHYLVGRKHGASVTLPYFIPFPLSPFGTLGAFINMKLPPKNRRILMDIGIAGPLCGLIVALPVLIFGLSQSHLNTLPATIGGDQMLQMEGNSLLYLFLKFITFGRLLPSPVDYGNMPVILYWIRYFFTGQPYPLGGVDVMLNAVAWAGWAGILVTAMNLVPVGQLDGGHVLYVLIGKVKARRLFPIILVCLAALGLAWNGWWLWAALIFIFGRSYAEPLDQITEIDGKRKILAIGALIIFILVFTPIPLSLVY